MSIRIGINGFGRIGRNYLRLALRRGHEVVAVNDVANPATLAHLLKYDSAYGILDCEVGHDADAIVIDGHRITVSAEHDPTNLDWAGRGVDLVIESTGRFRRREEAAAHLKAGARKVVLSAPRKDVDATIVIGVNDRSYEHAGDYPAPTPHLAPPSPHEGAASGGSRDGTLSPHRPTGTVLEWSVPLPQGTT